MVVKEDGVNTVADCMIGLTRTNVDGKYCVDNGKDEQMELCLEELPNPKGKSSSSSTFVVAFLVFFGGRKVWLWDQISRKVSSTSIGRSNIEVRTSISFILCSGVRSFPPAFSLRR